MADPVVIVDYDSSWPDQFSRLRTRAIAALGTVAAEVEHIGSTAVPGLCAKPVIDLVVIVESEGDVSAAIQCLEAIGYRARGTVEFPAGRRSRGPMASRATTSTFRSEPIRNFWRS